MKKAKGSMSARADGNRRTPSQGPRSGAVGANGISKSRYPSRGTKNNLVKK